MSHSGCIYVGRGVFGQLCWCKCLFSGELFSHVLSALRSLKLLMVHFIWLCLLLLGLYEVHGFLFLVNRAMWSFSHDRVFKRGTPRFPTDWRGSRFFGIFSHWPPLWRKGLGHYFLESRLIQIKRQQKKKEKRKKERKERELLAQTHMGTNHFW